MLFRISLGCCDALQFSGPVLLLSMNTIILHLLLVSHHFSCLTCMSIAVLPVMLSSKLLPEMEVEETTKREQLLSGITNLPVPSQIEKLKVLDAENTNLYHTVID